MSIRVYYKRYKDGLLIEDCICNMDKDMVLGMLNSQQYFTQFGGVAKNEIKTDAKGRRILKRIQGWLGGEYCDYTFKNGVVLG